MDRLDRQVSLYCLCCISKYFSLERASYNSIYLCQPHKHRIHVWSQRWVPETGRLLRQGPVSAFQLGWQNPALRYFHTCSRLGGMPKNIACILFFVLICWYMCVQINYCHNNVEQTRLIFRWPARYFFPCAWSWGCLSACWACVSWVSLWGPFLLRRQQLPGVSSPYTDGRSQESNTNRTSPF